MGNDDGFVDRVIHDTVVRSVHNKYQDEIASMRRRNAVISRIMAIHGLASSIVTLPQHGTYLCIDIERLTDAQLAGIESVVMAVPPPMDPALAEDIAFDGMEDDGKLPEDD